MKQLIIGVAIGAGALAGAYSLGLIGSPATPAGTAAAGGAAGGRGGGTGSGGFGGGAFGNPPLTVELSRATRGTLEEEVTVVGSLVGDATVSVVPRVSGRLEEIGVRLGDRVRRGQRLAKIEDFEIVEQVRQAEAALDVSRATIRQREADLDLARTSVERSRSLFAQELLPRQTLDDNEARLQAATAQLDLARAQNAQSTARLDELRINLANTVVTSPVDGFVARRAVDQGAFVTQNAAVVDVVDISTVRLVANVVERDLRKLVAGNPTTVEVDAFPGEQFDGRIARVSPVLDPATRTAPIEIEISNLDFRLKPGMYARVSIRTGTDTDALLVPANALVDLGGRRGVFVPVSNQALFRIVQVGREQRDVVEVLGGIGDGDTVITTGAGSLRDGDTVLIAGDGLAGREDGQSAPAPARRGGGAEGDSAPAR